MKQHTTASNGSGFRKPFRAQTRFLVAAVSACFAAGVIANPVGPSVVAGTASIAQLGKVMTVTNSNGAILNWNQFNIAAGESTRFIQPTVSSAVLNRVLGADPSQIYGTLSSNGKVWLINPAGILVGASGRINTAGFVASTLGVSNSDFLAGRLNFGSSEGGTSGIGAVVNHGAITTSAGGTVYLVAPNVTNQGIITTPQGETILAAGQTVHLVDTGTPGVKVEIAGAEGNATNLGNIVANAGRIGIAGVMVRNSGSLNASSVVSEGGRVFLKASKDAYVDGAGRIVTTGRKGGSVEVLGNRVAVMDTASIDASGTGATNAGGGSIKIGGDYQGKNPEIQNANVTYFGPGASLKADAGRNGAGGRVIVWADDTTRAHGSISARGGAGDGDGGFVETSGKRYLSVDGVRVDTRASHGRTGTWLLDPDELTLLNGSGTDQGVSESSGVFSTTTAASTIYGAGIETALGTTNVTLQTGGGGGNGSITATGVTINSTTAYGLTMAAYGGASATGNITIADSNFSVNGGVTLLAGWDGSGFTSDDVIPAHGDIIIQSSTIQSGGGAVNLWAGKDISLSAFGTTGTYIDGLGMDVKAGNNLTLTGGDVSDDSTLGPRVVLHSSGTQFVTAVNQIKLQAGGAGNNSYGGNPGYGGSVAVLSNGDQTIAANVIMVYGGAIGHDNSAEIRTNGNQTINITGSGGLLELKGGGDSESLSYLNFAEISSNANQTINIDGGGSIFLRGGAGAGYNPNELDANDEPTQKSSNFARISMNGGSSFGQTITFTDGGFLSLYGGSNGNNNFAEVVSNYDQTISGDPAVLVQGGASGGLPRLEETLGDNVDGHERGNFAGITAGDNDSSVSTSSLLFSSLTIYGGDADFGQAGISGGQIDLTVTGDVVLIGGASSLPDPHDDVPNAAAAAYIVHDDDGSLTMHVTGDLALTGGRGSSGIVVIGSNLKAGVNLTVDGNLSVNVPDPENPQSIAGAVTIGSVASNPSEPLSGGGTSVIVHVGGDITLNGGNTATGSVLVGSPDDKTVQEIFDEGDCFDGCVEHLGSAPVHVELVAGKNIYLDGLTGGVMIGVKQPTQFGSVDPLPSSTVLMVAGGTRRDVTWTDDGEESHPATLTEASSLGGNIQTTGNVVIRSDQFSDASIEMVAFEGSAPAAGNITLGAGSVVDGDYISVTAGGDLHLDGVIARIDESFNMIPGTDSVDLRAGSQFHYVDADDELFVDGAYGVPTPVWGASGRGGSVTQSATSQVRALGGISISAETGTGALSGNIAQYYGGQIVSSNELKIVAGRDIKIDGQLEAHDYLRLFAGGDGADISVGNIELGGTSDLIHSGSGYVWAAATGDLTLNGSIESARNVYLYGGYSASQESASTRGGYVRFGANSNTHGREVYVDAFGGSVASSGDIFQDGGSITADLNVAITADRNVTLNGTLEAGGGNDVTIAAGANDFNTHHHSTTGGDVFIGNTNSETSVTSTGGSGSVRVTAYGGLENTGSITQYAGTINANYRVSMNADGGVNLDGSVDANNYINISAGARRDRYDGTNTVPVAVAGGDIVLGASSELTSNDVSLEASVGTNLLVGNVSQAGGSQLNSNSDLYVRAAGNVDLSGSVGIGDGGEGGDGSHIFAGAVQPYYEYPPGGGYIYHDGEQVFLDKHITVNSLTATNSGYGYGTSVTLSATGPITATIHDADYVTASIANQSESGSIAGGIGISTSGAKVPVLDLQDHADTGGAVSFTRLDGDLVLNDTNFDSDTFVIDEPDGLLTFGASGRITWDGLTVTAASRIALNAGGAIDQLVAIDNVGRPISSLSTISVGGTDLTLDNVVGIYTGSNSVSGDIDFNNTAAPLTIAQVSNSAGNVTVDNTGGIVISGSVNASGTVGVTAHSPITVSSTGTVTAGGDITLTATPGLAGDSLLIAGSVSSNGGVIELVGGTVILDTTGQVSATNGGSVEIAAVGAQGDIIQHGGTISASTDVSLVADRNVNLNGQINAVGKADVLAGVNSVGTTGGDITLGASSSIVAGDIVLIANRDTGTGSFTTGNVLQQAGGSLQTGSDFLVNASGNIDMLGTAVGNAAGRTNLLAGFNNTTATEQAFTGKHVTANNLQASGGNVSIQATAGINAVVQSGGVVGANINNSAAGGLNLTSYGASALVLSDKSVANSGITVNYFGNAPLTLNSNSAFETTNGAGSVSIAANAGNLIYSGSNILANGLTLTASGTITQTATLTIATLNTTSTGGTVLSGNNTVAQYSGLNNGTGDIVFKSVNAPGLLLANSVSADAVRNNAATGGIVLTSSGAGGLILGGNIVGQDAIALTSGGNIDHVIGTSISNTGNANGTGSVNISGATVTLGKTQSRDDIIVTAAGALNLLGDVRANDVIALNATGNVTQGASTSISNVGSGPGDINISGAAVTLRDVRSSHQMSVNATGALRALDTGPSFGLSAVGNITLVAGGVINAMAKLTGAGLSSVSVGGASYTGPNQIATVINMTNTGSGNVVFNNTASPLTIASMSNSAGDVTVDNFGKVVIGGPVRASGSLSVTAHSPLTVTSTGSVSAGGNINLTASSTSAASTIDLLTIAGPVTSDKGNIDLFGGSGITVTNTVTAKDGNVVAKSPFGRISETPAGLVTAPKGTVTPNPFTNGPILEDIVVVPPAEAQTIADVDNVLKEPTVVVVLTPPPGSKGSSALSDSTTGGTPGTFGGEDDKKEKDSKGAETGADTPAAQRFVGTCT